MGINERNILRGSPQHGNEGESAALCPFSFPRTAVSREAAERLKRRTHAERGNAVEVREVRKRLTSRLGQVAVSIGAKVTQTNKWFGSRVFDLDTGIGRDG